MLNLELKQNRNVEKNNHESENDFTEILFLFIAHGF